MKKEEGRTEGSGRARWMGSREIADWSEVGNREGCRSLAAIEPQRLTIDWRKFWPMLVRCRRMAPLDGRRFKVTTV
jgi:hypothetical protein